MLCMAPQDEVLNPHGEERGNAAVSNREAREYGVMF
jgi:hypothetical protein